MSGSNCRRDRHGEREPSHLTPFYKATLLEAGHVYVNAHPVQFSRVTNATVGNIPDEEKFAFICVANTLCRCHPEVLNVLLWRLLGRRVWNVAGDSIISESTIKAIRPRILATLRGKPQGQNLSYALERACRIEFRTRVIGEVPHLSLVNAVYLANILGKSWETKVEPNYMARSATSFLKGWLKEPWVPSAVNSRSVYSGIISLQQQMLSGRFKSATRCPMDTEKARGGNGNP